MTVTEELPLLIQNKAPIAPPTNAWEHAFNLIPEAKNGDEEALNGIATYLDPLLRSASTQLFRTRSNDKLRRAYDPQDIAN